MKKIWVRFADDNTTTPILVEVTHIVTDIVNQTTDAFLGAFRESLDEEKDAIQ